MTPWRFKGAMSRKFENFRSFRQDFRSDGTYCAYFAGGAGVAAGCGVAAGAGALPAVAGDGLAATAACGWAAGLIQQA